MDKGLKVKFIGEENYINIDCIECAEFIHWFIVIKYKNGAIYECGFETDIGFMELSDIKDKINREYKGYVSKARIMTMRASIDESPYIEKTMDWLQSITIMNELINMQ